jgi:hypothetical protein
LLPLPAIAADDAALNALRAEIEALKSDYAARVATLEARLEQLEAVPQPPPEPAAPPPPASAGAGQSAYNPSVSVILTGTYSNLSQDPADWAIAGFLPGGDEVGPNDRSFSLGESEITFAANVDPFFTASLTVALDGAGEAGVEEAFFRTTSLPHGLSVKGGRFFSGVGYLNEVHAHAWDFADQPLIYQAFFGGQFAQDGVQLKWLAPTDLFLEFGAEAGNGDSFPGTGTDGNGLNGTTLFAHAGGDIGDSIGWRAGISWMDLDAIERAYDDVDSLGNVVTNAFTGSSETWIADATLKWSPGGDARRNSIKLQAEYMQRTEDGRLAYDIANTALTGSYRSKQDGWYVQGVYQFTPRWRAGLRYDDLDPGSTRLGLVSSGVLTPADFPLLAPGSPSRVSMMVDFNPSEFTRLRAQYNFDDARDTTTDEQWLLQYIYAIGAHGAHKF